MVASARMRSHALPALALVAALQALPAHALFEDDEARKAILDLRAKVAQMEQEQRGRNAELSEQLGQLRRSLLELNGAIEALRADMAKLRGQDEQLARDVAELQRKQRDVQTGIEDRIRQLEPQKVAIDGKEFFADPEEKRQFDEAFAVFRAGEFDKSVAAFGAFQRRWPASGYRESALFWLGNAQYARREYKDAIASFRALLAASPGHAKAPEAMLAIANCQIELKDRAGAKRTVDELVKAHPASEAAQAGKERMAAMR